MRTVGGGGCFQRLLRPAGKGVAFQPADALFGFDGLAIEGAGGLGFSFVRVRVAGMGFGARHPIDLIPVSGSEQRAEHQQTRS